MRSFTSVVDPDRPGSHRTKSAVKVILLFVLAAVFLATAVWVLPVKQYLYGFLEWIQRLGTWGPVFVVGFYVLAAVLFIPGSVLTLGAGFLFGVVIGTFTVWIGANLGACAAFIVGRTIARDWVARRIASDPKFSAIDDAVEKEGFKIVLLLRLSPAFPFNLLNYALGLTKISFGKYVLANMIGMFPATLMYVYFGSAARSLADAAAGNIEQGAAGQVFFWFGLAATIAVAVFVTRLAARSLKLAQASSISSNNATETNGPQSYRDMPAVLPDDAHNRRLVSNVHPSDWTNPEPAERYNLVVIGGGTAGLVTAAGSAGLGARVALVEHHLLGGDCLNVGCVPSKSLIRSSRIVHEIKLARYHGISVPDRIEVDFGKVMERMRSIRAEISPHDSAKRLRSLGVDVFLGHARFTGPDAIRVGGKTLPFKKAVIATGARAFQPKIEGLSEAGFLTNETVFSLTEQPARLAVIGGGPIGCEMAQLFQRLGSQIFLFHKNDHILDREDSDAAEIVQKRLIEEGVSLMLNCNPYEIDVRDKEKVIHFEMLGKKDSISVDEILVGVGRAPNVENLNLESAEVQYDTRRGVFVNDYLQTTNSNIFAAGDVCMNYKFTHAADAAARIVIQNALFKGSKKVSSLIMPWCTYTDPEIAHVGLYEKEAAGRGIKVDTYFRALKDVDRAVADGEDDGFVKIHTEKGKDKILGATIVASHAGEMLSEITLAMAGNLGLKTISGIIHPYPTQSEAIKHIADAYNRSRLTPVISKLFERWFAWTR